MSKINQNVNAPMNTLKPQPGQYDSYNPKFHPLPGEWAREQLSDPQNSMSSSQGKSTSKGNTTTQIQKALATERAQHEYWMEWQGMIPGKPVYANPRETQNTLLPSAKYGTEGSGYGS